MNSKNLNAFRFKMNRVLTKEEDVYLHCLEFKSVIFMSAKYASVSIR
jgi:hypothetical protein